MKKITKIVIKASSDNACTEDSFKEKITVTGNSFSYKYKPGRKSKFHDKRKWEYSSNGIMFTAAFNRSVNIVEEIISKGSQSFEGSRCNVKLAAESDGKLIFKGSYPADYIYLEGLFSVLSEFIPFTEYFPELFSGKIGSEDLSEPKPASKEPAESSCLEAGGAGTDAEEENAFQPFSEEPAESACLEAGSAGTDAEAEEEDSFQPLSEEPAESSCLEAGSAGTDAEEKDSFQPLSEEPAESVDAETESVGTDAEEENAFQPFSEEPAESACLEAGSAGTDAEEEEEDSFQPLSEELAADENPDTEEENEVQRFLESLVMTENAEEE